jgi:hypothetical protein
MNDERASGGGRVAWPRKSHERRVEAFYSIGATRFRRALDKLFHDLYAPRRARSSAPGHRIHKVPMGGNGWHFRCAGLRELGALELFLRLEPFASSSDSNGRRTGRSQLANLLRARYGKLAGTMLHDAAASACAQSSARRARSTSRTAAAGAVSASNTGYPIEIDTHAC